MPLALMAVLTLTDSAGGAPASVPAITTAGSAPAANATTAAAAPTWLAMGDSISSGYGITSVSKLPSAWAQECARADGIEVNDPQQQLAWPVRAARDLNASAGNSSQYRQFFTACAGNLTDDWAVQVAEAYTDLGVRIGAPIQRGTPTRDNPLVTELNALAASGRRFDVLTVTMGANNVGLGLFGQGCLDLGNPDGSARTWTSSRWGGCDASTAQVHEQVDLLVGRKQATGSARLLAGQVPLWSERPSEGHVEPMLAALTRFVRPGGRLIVAGYPQVVEEPTRSTLAARWQHVPGLANEVGNCAGFSPAAAREVRAAISYLNDGIAQAAGRANAAQAATSGDGQPPVRVSYVDLNDLAVENSAGRHALCTQTPWIVDPFVTTGGMLHPNGAGHTGIGQAFARYLRG